MFHLTSGEIDSLIADIRTQKSLITALSSSQPIIDEVARVADVIFDEVAASLDKVAHHLMARIDRANEDVLAIQKAIRTGQYRVFKDLIRLGEYRRFQD
ncbi:MAG: hypothetical protein O7D32_06410, partial [bacterium]|nr:hypothetical protein [bacterium]